MRYFSLLLKVPTPFLGIKDIATNHHVTSHFHVDENCFVIGFSVGAYLFDINQNIFGAARD